jgi:hypothetical protein
LGVLFWIALRNERATAFFIRLGKKSLENQW